MASSGGFSVHNSMSVIRQTAIFERSVTDYQTFLDQAIQPIITHHTVSTLVEDVLICCFSSMGV